MIRLAGIRTAGARGGKVALLAAALAVMSSCKPVPLNAPEKKEDADVPVLRPTLPDLAVDRAQLLRALDEAASAAALGLDDAAAQNALAGRQFVLKLPIGCDPAGDAPTGWNFDAGAKRLTLRAAIDITLASYGELGFTAGKVALAPPTSGEAAAATKEAPSINELELEEVDGFWIKRPWVKPDTCPLAVEPPATLEPAATPEESAASGSAAPTAQQALDGTETDAKPSVTAAPQSRVGIAQFFTSQDPRTGRRGGQPYQITKRLSDGETFDPKSLRLVLRGRLTGGADGKVIRCHLVSADEQPYCIASATFDRVSFENANGSIVYGQWGGG